MYGTNLNAEPNFHLQAFNQYGIKYVTGPYTSYNLDVFRAFTATTDCVITATAVVGDSLTNEIIYAGTTVYGLFISIVVTSGNAVLHLAEPSVISELVNSYYNTAAQYGYYSEAQKCTSERLNPYLAGGLYDKASWLLIPSQVEEDFVRTFKPTDNSGSLSFTRASDATRTNAAGEIERTPWNLVLDSEMFSTASWPKFNLTVSANVVTAPNGTLTADKIVENATNNNHYLSQSVSNRGSLFTYSIYAKKAERDFLYINAFATIPNNFTYVPTAYFNLSNGTLGIVSGCTASIQDAGNGWYRCVIQTTSIFSQASATVTFYNYTSPANGVNSYLGDGTSGIFLWGAQLVEGTDAKPYFPTTNRLDVPRLDYRNTDGTVNSCPRLLLEPQRTNSIRNSTMVGAIAGSPGTLPTNWGISAAGLTRTIVGIGTESGLTYIDVRFNGTATSGQVSFNLEVANSISATAAQSWTLTSYAKLISGTINDARLSWDEFNSSLGYVATKIGTVTVGSTLTRVSYTNTTSATCAFVQPQFRTSVTIGVAYDFTIRIAAPQMELGAYATTFIPTTTAAVTRLVDAANKTGISSLIGQTDGTIFIDLQYNQTTPDLNGRLLQLWGTNDTTNSILPLIIGPGANVNQFQLTTFSAGVSSVVVAAAVGTTVPFGRQKFAIAYNSGAYTVYRNGSLFASGSGLVPVSLTALDLGGSPFAARNLSNPVNQAALFPTRLSNEELVTLTTL
jgi:hypothetical protein